MGREPGPVSERAEPPREDEARLGPEVLVALDRAAGGPLHRQLETSLRDQVRSGRLPPGSKLPSSRSLAASLGVSRGVVLEAYAQLGAEGYLVSSQGAPTRVGTMPSAERPPAPASSLEHVQGHSFDPVLPDLGSFPWDRWTRSIRAALREAPFAALGYGDPRGTPELRNELMAYLGRVRGAAPEPEHTIVCGGATQGFALLCRVLRARGIDRVAVEAPGFSRHRVVAEGAGLEPVGIRVDEHGLDVAELARSESEVVVVTPAHQFPTGVVMSSERRAALLEWAEDEDGLIVEDDYDSELRYDRVPVGALQGLAPERVLHLGSASKRLAPGLRIGWMLSPSWLSGALTYEQGLTTGPPPALEQRALADFIARGELDRHLRRMRLRYRARRRALIEELMRALPEAELTGVSAGLHVLAVLPAGTDEHAVLHAAAESGVWLEGLSAHMPAALSGAGAGVPGSAGVLLGYANLSQADVEHGVAAIARALER